MLNETTGKKSGGLFLAAVMAVIFFTLPAGSFAADWDTTLAAARKEGKVVIGTAVPNADLRKTWSKIFKERYGIELELIVGRGSKLTKRIVTEIKAGVNNFDVINGGSSSILAVFNEGFLEPLPSRLILPEVKNPQKWFAGHVWNDNVKTNRYLYSFIADAQTGGLFRNTALVKEGEIRSFDDYLNPKWKGKIGWSDPRIGGAGRSIWSWMWDVKGQEYLRRIVKQDLFITRNIRQLADTLAKGKLALTLGASYVDYKRYIDAGLPVKQIPTPKEGLPSSNGHGVIGIIKDSPHPNAAIIFVNWLLSKEGQDLFTKAMRQATRRFDVDTRWLSKVGKRAAKDSLTVDEYNKARNHLEDKVKSVRYPAAKFARKIVK